MIYLKRFSFVIVMFLSILIGIFGTLIVVLSSPLWGFLYFILTGDDPFKDEIFTFIWENVGKFVEWYCDKIGME